MKFWLLFCCKRCNLKNNLFWVSQNCSYWWHSMYFFTNLDFKLDLKFPFKNVRIFLKYNLKNYNFLRWYFLSNLIIITTMCQALWMCESFGNSIPDKEVIADVFIFSIWINRQACLTCLEIPNGASRTTHTGLDFAVSFSCGQHYCHG